MRIIFMGTPEFAVESLKALVDRQFNVVAVVTMPDKPAGRGHKIQYSAVKQYALSQGIPVLQPEKLKDEAFLAELKSYQADLQIVVAFRMLPEVVWNMPPLGTFNLHASLLPQYRGAAPINWVIMNGEKETGATTFFLTHEIDTGKVILQEKIPVSEDDNAGTLHDKLMVLGSELVCKTVEQVAAGNVIPLDQSLMIQDNTVLKLAPKIFKDDCRLRFDIPVQKAHNFVRGLSPYPAAWTILQFPTMNEPANFKIFGTEAEIVNHNEKPGEIITDGKTFAKIAMPDGFLKLISIQPADRKRMSIADFLRGLR
jgi:methionyl-tRNA formyltransferase